MESSQPCKSCRKRTLVPDDVTGNTVCSSCGVVQDYDNFQAHIGGITGDAGTYIRVGTVGTGNAQNYKEKKIYEAQKLFEDFMLKLGLSGAKSLEIKRLIEQITDREYGVGKWFPVFVGACAYVVMRKDQKAMPIVEVANVIGSDEYELGRMINRVVDFVDLKLPEFDIVYSFERAIKNCHSFGEVSEDLVGRMLQQGVFLIQCLIKWFVTTGRRPMPVVAAVLVFVGELNQIQVKLEDVANELQVAVKTCRLRYKELLERLVEVAQALPWGENITKKNILKNAPFVIQYMEIKSRTKCNDQQLSFEHFQCDIEELVGDCLRRDTEYGFDTYAIEECNTHYFEGDHPRIDYPDKLQISPESLTLMYSNIVEEQFSLAKSTGEMGVENQRRKRIAFDLQACMDWWQGKSDLSKKLCLKQVLEKDVGLDALPPSFDKACLDNKKRQEKIKAARFRIQKIMHPVITSSANSSDLCIVELEKSKKRKRVQVDMDWEDLIIETLLLHNVKEEEIEKGHYNVLLALHVFS